MPNCLFKKYDDEYRCEYCGKRVKYYGVQATCTAKQMPSLATRVANFIPALASHVAGGMQTVPNSIKDERYALCRSCPLFKLFNEETGDGACTHGRCGCNVHPGDGFLNKINWADQECPIGKWGKYEENTEISEKPDDVPKTG